MIQVCRGKQKFVDEIALERYEITLTSNKLYGQCGQQSFRLNESDRCVLRNHQLDHKTLIYHDPKSTACPTHPSHPFEVQQHGSSLL